MMNVVKATVSWGLAGNPSVAMANVTACVAPVVLTDIAVKLPVMTHVASPWTVRTTICAETTSTISPSTYVEVTVLAVARQIASSMT
jgi:hypothetical protein